MYRPDLYISLLSLLCQGLVHLVFQPPGLVFREVRRHPRRFARASGRRGVNYVGSRAALLL